MTDRLPVENTGKWKFQLQQAQNLQFRIASEQETDAPLIIEGHDISTLLDYLYDNRELIYKATHDRDGHHLGVTESRDATVTARSAARQIERIFYIDDGEGRKRSCP